MPLAAAVGLAIDSAAPVAAFFGGVPAVARAAKRNTATTATTIFPRRDSPRHQREAPASAERVTELDVVGGGACTG
jgi:hypothetical protein